MTNNATVKPEWLEIIACCCPKVQMDLIRAIVTWQTEGSVPDFRGTKKALFLMMVHDLTGETSVAEPDTAAVMETKTETDKETDTETNTETDTEPDSKPVEESSAPRPAEQSEKHEPQPAPSPAPRRKDSRRNFFPYHPLY